MHVDSKLKCIKAMFGSVIKPHILIWGRDNPKFGLITWINYVHLSGCKDLDISTCTHVWEGPLHGDVIIWKHFSRYWPCVQWIHRPSVNSPHKSQWRGALMFSLICARTNGWVDNSDAGDLRCHLVHYEVTVMFPLGCISSVSFHMLHPIFTCVLSIDNCLSVA